MSRQQRSHVSLNAVAEEQCQVKLYNRENAVTAVSASLNETCVPPIPQLYILYIGCIYTCFCIMCLICLCRKFRDRETARRFEQSDNPPPLLPAQCRVTMSRGNVSGA